MCDFFINFYEEINNDNINFNENFKNNSNLDNLNISDYKLKFYKILNSLNLRTHQKYY